MPPIAGADLAAWYSVSGGARNLPYYLPASAAELGKDSLITMEAVADNSAGILLLKLGLDGGVLGKSFLDMGSDTTGVQLLGAEDGSVLALGSARQGDQGLAVFIAKLDSSLGIKKAAMIGGGTMDRPAKLVPVAGNGYFHLAATQSWDLARPGILVARIDGDLRPQWIKTLAGSGLEEPVDIVAAQDGGAYLVANERAKASASRDILVARLDAAGKLSWQRRIGASGDDEALCASPTQGSLRVLFRSGSLRKDGAAELGMLALDGKGTLSGQWYFQNSRAELMRSAMASPDGGFLICWNDKPGRDDATLTNLKSIDVDGAERWGVSLQDTVDLKPLFIASGELLYTAGHADPAGCQKGNLDMTNPSLLGSVPPPHRRFRREDRPCRGCRPPFPQRFQLT